MSRLVLSILRNDSEPLTSRDIPIEMLVTRARDRSDKRLMVKRIGVALGHQQNNGLVRCSEEPGQYKL